MVERTGYSGLQIGLHWLIAVLILVNWFLGESAEELMERIEDGVPDPGFSAHIPIGLLIFLLVLVRIAVKLMRGGPMPPGVPGSLPVRAAMLGHGLLYLLMLAVPLGGATAFFLGIEDAGDLHGLAANLLMLVALGHAVVALYHQHVLKDGLMRRMMKAE